MSAALLETARNNTYDRVPALPSGLAIGKSEYGQLVQLLWQPKAGPDGQTLEIVRVGKTTTNSVYNYTAITGVRTIVRDANGQEASSFISLGTVKRHRAAYHFASLNYAGNELLKSLVFTPNLSEIPSLLNPSDESRKLDRYAASLIMVQLADLRRLGNPVEGDFQLMARRPGLGFGVIDALSARALSKSVEVATQEGQLANGVAICIDEYTGNQPSALPIHVFEDATTIAQQYKSLLGPGVEGAVKGLLPHGQEEIVLFSDLN